MPNNKIIFGLICAIGLTLLLFGIWPKIDLAVTGYFYDPSNAPVVQNPFLQHPWVGVLRKVFWDATLLIPLLALILLIWTRARQPVLGLPARLWGFVLLLFLLGPGLVVNGILKAHWGRARPINVVEFGGTLQFTPAWQISDQCAANCSFVSGEGAGTMAMTLSVLLILHLLRHRLPKVALRLGQAATIAILAFVGWQRVASGGHFLSDVLLSWLLTALIAAILARLMLNQDAPAA